MGSGATECLNTIHCLRNSVLAGVNALRLTGILQQLQCAVETGHPPAVFIVLFIRSCLFHTESNLYLDRVQNGVANLYSIRVDTRFQ